MTTLGYTIVFVKEMQRSIEFYRDVLGFSLKFDSPHWTELLSGERTLALHLEEDSQNDEPKKNASGTCQFGIWVPNLDEFHEQMTSQKVRCVSPPQEQFGARIAKYADPDGLPFSVSEPR